MTSGSPPISAVVFDLGGVLVDWNPRHLYRKLFGSDEAAMEHFLAHVCTQAWNEEQDAGRPFSEGVALLSAEHPTLAPLISAYDLRWEEMLRGEYAPVVALLATLRARAIPLYALSNWSAEKFPLAERRFEFLRWFDGIVISGRVGLKKPDPRLFAHVVERFSLSPTRTLFVDDVRTNVDAARALGFVGHHFTDAQNLAAELVRQGLLDAD